MRFQRTQPICSPKLLGNILRSALLVAVGCVIGCNSENLASSVDSQLKASSELGPAVDSISEEVPAKSADPGRIVDKDFDDIKFDIEPDAPFFRKMLTPEIEAMSGTRIKIRGYILPTAQKRGIKQFVLVRDNQECCFGPGAALYDCILVSMTEGSSAEFSIRPVAVEGTFLIEEFKGPDGRHLAVFQMEGEKVK